MPAEQRGSAYRTERGWGVRWREDGRRHHESGFHSKTEALNYFDDHVRPRLRGMPTPTTASTTFDELCTEYLERHAAIRETGTIETLRDRLKRPRSRFGHMALRELERQASEVAKWRTSLPERSAYGIMQAFRQVCAAAVEWGWMARNPAKLAGPNPQPKPRELLILERDEVEKLAAELDRWGPMVVFAFETGLRPSEWIALEHRDLDRDERVVRVERSFTRGQLKAYGKTGLSRRRVPLSASALEALNGMPRRLNSPLVFPAPGGGGGVSAGYGEHIDLRNWRRRHWAPKLKKADLGRRQVYSLRHSFASHALAAGISTFELSRVMGTSVGMIDKTYGHLVKGSETAMRERLDAYATGRLGVKWASE